MKIDQDRLRQFIQSSGLSVQIKLHLKHKDRKKGDEFKRWRVRLLNEDHRFTCYFPQKWFQSDPTEMEAMNLLLLDCYSIDQCESFFDWCEQRHFTVGDESHAIFRGCKNRAFSLFRYLGESLYNDFMGCVQEEVQIRIGVDYERFSNEALDI